jgi:AcrR family transcriptional regulator
MQDRTKQIKRAGRPRKFDEGEALGKMQRQLWTTGLSGTSVEEIARSAGLNRPSLAAAFGDKDAIYAQAAAQYAAMMDERLSQALGDEDLEAALRKAFDTAINIYTDDGPDGCFVICTAPAEAPTNPVCRDILDQSLNAIDALFLQRLEKEKGRMQPSPADLTVLAAQLGATLHSLALRARAGWARDKLCIGILNALFR